MDLEALEDEFAANSWPKTVEKAELLEKLRLMKTVLLLSFFLDDLVYVPLPKPTICISNSSTFWLLEILG